MSCGRAAACCLLLGLMASLPAAEPANPVEKNSMEIAGTAEFLRSVPKRFATLQAVDAGKGRVTLLADGEKQPRDWPVVPDAEIKVAGWWGRLDQFMPGQRVWAWFRTDRAKQPVAVAMLADELSEQDIRGGVLAVVEATASRLTVKSPRGAAWQLAVGAETQCFRGKESVAASDLKAGDRVYVCSDGGRARLVLDPAAFAARQAEQQALLRKRWTEQGLPGTATFLHVFSGEMECMLDHEAMRWGRSLKPGDKVTLAAPPGAPIAAVVKDVRPWRERTQLRLVVNGVDMADLRLGQRLGLRMTPPPAEVDAGPLPPDVDRPRGRGERIEWFLASTYCTCKIGGDVCTGQFYTLASCNPNGCGMPNHVRRVVGEKIDRGMTDRQIFEELLKKQGPNLVRPHLVP